MKVRNVLLASVIMGASFAVLVPAAEAGCYYPATVNTVSMCAYANAGAGYNGPTNYRFTSSGSCSSTIPATCTLTSSKTNGWSCSITSGSCFIGTQVAMYPTWATGPCNTVSVRVAVTVVGTPGTTDYDTACAGSGLVDPVGLALEVAAQAENTVGGLLP